MNDHNSRLGPRSRSGDGRTDNPAALRIYDTTLRDGTQREGISLSVDDKIRILDGRSGTAATTRVLIGTETSRRRWSTVGASPNIIEASWRALADGIEYGLWLARESHRVSTTVTPLQARSRTPGPPAPARG
jgi:hypothetical protein